MTRKSDKAKFLFLMLYFLILTIERIISLATVLTSDIAGYDLLDLYMSVLTAAAIIGAYTYMFLKVRFTAKPRSSDKPEQSVFGKLAIAAGILLLGGMVHTDGTIPPIQFAAYGMILISMARKGARRRSYKVAVIRLYRGVFNVDTCRVSYVDRAFRAVHSSGDHRFSGNGRNVHGYAQGVL